MLRIKTVAPEYDLTLDVGELASYIYDMTNDKPCSIYVKGTESDFLFISEFEDVPTNLICYNFSGDCIFVIEHDHREVEKYIRKLGKIIEVFEANVEMSISLGQRIEVNIVN